MIKKILSLVIVLCIFVSSVPVFAALPVNYKDIIDVPWQTYFADKKLNLDEYKNVHPRIWLDNNDFERIKGYAENEYSSLWRLIEKSATTYANAGPEEFTEDGENTWMNGQGKKLVALAFAYKISGEQKYLDAINKFVDVISAYPSWSNEVDGDNCHLAGQSSFLGFGIVYDWCYDVLSEETKQKIVDNIATRIEDYNYDVSYGFDSINCHNMIVINTSAYVALSAMYEKIPKAETYMKRIAAKLATLTMEVMPDDGAMFEAANYSSLTWIGIMQAGLVMRDLMNIDIISHPTMDAHAKFACYSYIPTNGFKSGHDIFGWGDGTESSDGNLLPVMSLMAKERQNPVYKYFVEKRLEYAYEKNSGGTMFIYALMFADPSLEAKSPDEYKDNKNGKLYFPLDFVTPDTGYTFLRDSWSGDEASIHFHCGPILGETAADFRKVWKGNTLGVGHNHPDMASLLIFAEGEWLFKDDNYVTGMTGNHNTLLINGMGQRAEHGKLRNYDTDLGFTPWQAQNLMKPAVVKTETFGDMTYIVCDVTDAYPDYHYGKGNLNLKGYKRHYIYLKPEKTLLVIDDVKTYSEADLELRWRPFTQVASLQNDGSYLYKNKYSSMRIEGFSGDGVEVKNSLVQVNSDKSSNYKDTLILQLKKHGKEWIQATSISWQRDGLGAPLNTSYKNDGNTCTFNTNDSVITVDLKTLEIARKKNNLGLNLKVDDNLIFPEKGITSKDGISYLNKNELVKILNLSEKDGVISNKENKIKLSELKSTYQDENGELYIPVRELCEKLKIALWWDNDAKSVNIDTKADTSDVSIFSVSVCGNETTPDENGNYTVELFTDKVSIDVVPKANGATCEVELTETGFGENKVKLVSLDKTNVKEFTVTVNPVKTLGKYPVYNVQSNAGYSEIMAMLDGQDETAWAVNGSGVKTVFDLGSVVDLSSVSISLLHGAMRQQIFKISVSEDGETFEEVFNGKASGTTVEFESYAINKRARFVEIIFGGHTNGGGWNNTKEIKFD